MADFDSTEAVISLYSCAQQAFISAACKLCSSHTGMNAAESKVENDQQKEYAAAAMHGCSCSNSSSNIFSRILIRRASTIHLVHLQYSNITGAVVQIVSAFTQRWPTPQVQWGTRGSLTRSCMQLINNGSPSRIQHVPRRALEYHIFTEGLPCRSKTPVMAGGQIAVNTSQPSRPWAFHVLYTAIPSNHKPLNRWHVRENYPHAFPFIH